MIKEKFEINGFNQVKFPKLKGHLKITLKNVHNGKTEVIEGDNIVTNAMRDIFINNYLGKIDYSVMMPLWQKWFGGVLLYENAHTLNPDNYFLHSDNHIFAHAGSTAIDSEHDDDLTRGNPVAPAFVQTADSVKQVWEWGPSRGNVPGGRFIRALSLTHKDFGNAGLNGGYFFSNLFSPLEVLFNQVVDVGIATGDSVLFPYDDNHGMVFTIQPDGTYWGDQNPTPTNVVNFYLKRLPYFKAGLFETLNADNDVTRMKKFSVSTSITFYQDPCFYWDDTTRRLWLFTNITGHNSSSSTAWAIWDKSIIQYSIIDLSDLDNAYEYAHGTLTSDTSDLAPIGVGFPVQPRREYGEQRYQVIKDGDAFWFPLCDSIYFDGASGYNFGINAKAMKRISTVSADQLTSTFDNVVRKLHPGFYGGSGVVVNDGGVNYGANGYKCTTLFEQDNTSNEWMTRAFNQSQKPVSYVVATDIHNYNTSPAIIQKTRYIIANKMLNTTLFNLPSPIQKTSSQSMTVEYTLQEVSGGDES